MERLVVVAVAASLVCALGGGVAWVGIAVGQGKLNGWLVGAMVTGAAALVVIAWWAFRGDGRRKP